MKDLIRQHGPQNLGDVGTSLIPPIGNEHHPTIGKITCRGKKKLETTFKNTMKADQVSANIDVKRRQSSSQTRLVEIIENQGKEIMRSMKLLSLVEEQNIAVVGNIVEKQLEYLNLRDKQVAAN